MKPFHISIPPKSSSSTPIDPARLLPAGGTALQALRKIDGTDYNVEWFTLPSFSLTNWSESIADTGVNATIPVSIFSAVNAATNVDAALCPKAAGSILAQVPDGGTLGGNKRGQKAVDLQMSRTANTQVAAGLYSSITGGENNQINTSARNTIIGGGTSNQTNQSWSGILGGANNNISGSGSYTVIGGGRANTSNQGYGFIGGGETNAINTNTHASILGGSSNTASGLNSSVLGGLGNTANGPYSIASGRSSSTRGIEGVFVEASNALAGVGSSQHARYKLLVQTTTAAVTEMTASGLARSATNTIVLPNNYSFKFRGVAIARSTAGDVKSWDFFGTIKRGANAAATSLIAIDSAVDAEDAGTTTWSMTIDADTTNGSLRFQATGAAATTIRWMVLVYSIEVG